LAGIIDAPDNASGSAPSISSLPNAYSPAIISSRLTALTSTLVLALSSAVRILFTRVHCSIHRERNRLRFVGECGMVDMHLGQSVERHVLSEALDCCRSRLKGIHTAGIADELGG